MAVWVPIVGVCVVTLAYCGYPYGVQPVEEHDEPQTVRTPFRRVLATPFGVLYAGILVLSNGAQTYFGDAGMYLSSVVAGLVDVDAIPLSMARLHESGDLGTVPATRRS